LSPKKPSESYKAAFCTVWGRLRLKEGAKTLTFSLTIAAPSKKERDGAFPAKVSRRLFRQKPYVSDRAKVTPVLWKHKTNSDGHSPIYLRIYASGQTKYKSLSVSIPPGIGTSGNGGCANPAGATARSTPSSRASWPTPGVSGADYAGA
jgi:hypothetical protein